MAGQITPFGTTKDGCDVQAIHLKGGALQATVLTHGASLQSLYLKGIGHSLTLGFPDLAPYDGAFAHFGAVIAPVVNRLGGASAWIDGVRYTFSDNVNGNTLHSGPAGSHHAVWDIAHVGPSNVTLELHQPAGAGGFPGNRRITASYWVADNVLSLKIEAETDATTLMNIAHHGYWNMDGTRTWSGHKLQVHADHYLPSTNENLPTGKVAAVAGTAFDFRTAQIIKSGTQQRLDNNFCPARERRDLTPVITFAGESGVEMVISTTEPGVQVFDAATINADTAPTIHDHFYQGYSGMAFEPQCWPDAPNNPDFPNILLHPGAPYRQHTTFKFTS